MKAGLSPSALEQLSREYYVTHVVPGRVRLRPIMPGKGKATGPDARLLDKLEGLFDRPEITVSARTGSILICYGPALATNGRAARGNHPPKATADTQIGVRNPIPGKLRSFFYPRVFVFASAIFRSVPYIGSALMALFKGRVGLDVLDGAALLVCLVQRDFKSLSSITFFFALGEYLAEWTRKKSRASLVESLALNIDQVWIQDGDVEIQIPFTRLEPGNRVVVRAGSALPVDGTVVEGEGMVNQASMTGEPLAVPRSEGATVYAGTILEEGELVIKATKVGMDTRLNAILKTIEESESVKAALQGRYERMADAIVPYNFLLSGAVFALTRDARRAGSVLLVDYSCAIRLATPLSIFTAMREAADHGVLIKGGKYMEAIAEADVVVFDKTGTLTQAKPQLVDVIPFGGRKQESVLRLAACLEEHFAHPVGQAVVHASDEAGLRHREEHAQVEFIVAHGIASTWREQRVIIGSAHFVLEDEGVTLSDKQQELITEQAALGRSILYLAIDGKLAALLLIEDAIREDARPMVEALKRDGIQRVIMLTGDGEQTAASIASIAGIDEYHAHLLPEDKAAFIVSLKEQGYKVAMIGDGINDSPALSAAHVGIAMAEGADMAREIADIVLVNGELDGLLLARRISRAALARIRKVFHVSVLSNSIFLTGALVGLLSPGISALLHNATTAVVSVSSLQPLLSRTKPALTANSPEIEPTCEV